MQDKYEAIRLEEMKQKGFGPDIMKQHKVCRSCGKTCGYKEKYCTKCGAILPRETLFDLYKLYHLYCPDCDTVLASTSRFCPQCGRSLYSRKTSLFSWKKKQDKER